MIEHYSLPFEDQPFNLWQGQQEEMECLDEQVFLFNTRVTIKELEYLLSLPFSKFWAHLTKTDRVQAYLDTILANLRKVNDTYKLQVLASSGAVKKPKNSQSSIMMIGTSSGGSQARSYEVVNDMQMLLQVVFNLFCRISLQDGEGADDQKLPTQQYQDLVYQKSLIDIPKLYDIAAVYGALNAENVRKLISNVFESDNRYL